MSVFVFILLYDLSTDKKDCHFVFGKNRRFLRVNTMVNEIPFNV